MHARVTPELLQRLDRPGPRYTSYPTVPAWTAAFGPADWRAALIDLASQPRREVSLYVHLPYCVKRCHYCGCNAAIPERRADVDRYLDHLERELDLVAAVVGRRKVVQMHWGGGTPNFQTDAQLRRTWSLIADRFELTGEISLECDPRAGRADQPHLLRELGFNRISLGVQDFDPRVQDAIGRRQPEQVTRRFVAACRAARFESVNLDLVYGLPHQTPAVFGESLQKVIDLAPDRLAVFGYAHVPWAKPHQAVIDPATLPSSWERFALYQQAVETLSDAGYVWIGLDHFARPGDDLAIALGERRLHRNFMGYTTRPSLDMLAVGNSAIGEVCDRFAQNATLVGAYEASVASGDLPVVKGLRLTDDDRFRRAVILHLMCNLELPWDLPAALPGRSVLDLVPGVMDQLAPLAVEGLITLDDAGLQVTALGRYFLRNVAMVFDAYLATGEHEPRYSRTV
ncbi:MAG TPA: oxygen-independent coproporphyrinogen III oxidase [Candidatus Krumholzibacteria bacterium]|nr:oxygen-independent coproporphyrinogen III oxidase [Candidatus Krumholzibacteria bacterium]HPD71182.1 oxygen-independent coproporphyrinogen III oxidase [Candidatus Krumholzibacteria bacterium]HRY39118.1 oxygen-independent coproporphyrinogen III oxidase [Candidatus Krumholzibacteria bacterium]